MQGVNTKRRYFLAKLSGLAAAFLLPVQAVAALLNVPWNKAAFEAEKLAEAEKTLGANAAALSPHIEIIAPSRAENGAVVQIEITSNIANTESITLLVEHNPTPLISTFSFSNGALPFVITRIKMAEDSDVKVIVKAEGQYFSNSKKVIVLENGCG